MTHPLPQTRALLTRLRRRLRRFAWQHEIGWTLLVTCGWWLFTYGLDYFLHLPAPVRMFHTAVLVAIPTWFLGRRLVRHLTHLPSEAGLAVLAERGQPQNEDLLVTAVQLSQGAPGEGLQPIFQRAEARAQSLSLDPVLDPRAPRLALAKGIGAAVALVALYFGTRSTADIFLARMTGADVPWPQRTHLDIEIPGRADRMFVERDGDQIHVRLARGSDLPILVRAQGVVPDQVALVFDHGHETLLESGGSDRFRTQLRSIQQDLVFHARGGDDKDRRPEVIVEVLDPPDVGALAFRVTPPPYTGQPTRLERSTGIEVLANSEVQVFLMPDPAGIEGTAHILPEGLQVPLEPVDFPVEEGEPVPGLGLTLQADDSLRLRFALQGKNGLQNPDPGLFSIQVVEDRRPNLVLLAPAKIDTEVVAGGLLPLRVRAQDDFGLSELSYRIESLHGDGTALAEGSWPLEPLPEGAETPEGGEAGLRHELIEVDSFVPAGSAGEGAIVTLQASIDDNREPQAQTTRTAAVRLRVVTGDEYLRKLESRLAQSGEQGAQLSQRILRMQGNLSTQQNALQDDPRALAELDLSEVRFDVQRMEGDARQIARDLAGLAENLLYSRLDSRGEALRIAMDQRLARQASRAFDPEPWADLYQAYQAGQFGPADLSGDLLELVGLALRLSEQHAPDMAAALENEGRAPTAESLMLAYLEGQEALRTAEELTTRLGEWDNFQSVLTRTRDIIKRQRNLHERTRKFAKEQ